MCLSCFITSGAFARRDEGTHSFVAPCELTGLPTCAPKGLVRKILRRFAPKQATIFIYPQFSRIGPPRFVCPYSDMRNAVRLYDHKMPAVMSWFHPWDPERDPFTPTVFHIMRMRFGLTIAHLSRRSGLEIDRVGRFDHPRNPSMVMKPAGKTFRDALRDHVIVRIRERCIAQLAVIGTAADVRELAAKIEAREVERLLRKEDEAKGFGE